MVKCERYNTREEWLAHRRSFIGGSDAGAILGLNPWKTNVQLWEEKTGLKAPENIGNNPAVIYGTKAEEHLRALFTLDNPKYIVDYEPFNMWTNSRYPFAHASTDGVLTERETGRRGILEIKTANILSAAQREKWKGQIPPSYYAQIIWYLGVTGFDFAVLCAQLREEFGGEVVYTRRTYHVEREEAEEDISYLFGKAAEFAESVRTRTRPALLLPAI